MQLANTSGTQDHMFKATGTAEVGRASDPIPAALPPTRPVLRTGWRHDLQGAFRTIAALMLREMSARYGRSPGGYLWALVVPTGGIAIMALGFSLVLRSPPLGDSFMLFYATGMLPFTQFTDLDSVVARALRYSKALLAYPAVRWIDALLARFILNLLTKLLVTGIVLTSILAISDTRTFVDAPTIIMALSMAAALGFGMGALNCALMGLFPVWEMVWSIITRPLFLASGTLLLYRDLPSNIQAILWWNPLLHIVGEMRAGFYPMYDSSYVSPAYVFGVALTLMALGLLLVRRHHLTILNE